MDSERAKERQHYIDSLFRYDFEFNRLYDESLRQQREGVDLQPSITPQAGKLLALLIKSADVKLALEIGTGLGYSSHWLAGALKDQGGRLITIDNHHRTPAEAKRYLSSSGLSAAVEQLCLEAKEALVQFPDEQFDLIFQDGGKALYLPLYEECYRLLKVGGILAVDDVLFPFEEQARASQKEKVDRFNQRLAADERFYTVTLDIGHGLSLAIKEK